MKQSVVDGSYRKTPSQCGIDYNDLVFEKLGHLTVRRAKNGLGLRPAGRIRFFIVKIRWDLIPWECPYTDAILIEL